MTIRVTSATPPIDTIVHGQNDGAGIAQGISFLRGKVTSWVRDINPIDDVGVGCTTASATAAATTASLIASMAPAPATMLGSAINSINTMLLSSAQLEHK